VDLQASEAVHDWPALSERLWAFSDLGQRLGNPQSRIGT